MNMAVIESNSDGLSGTDLESIFEPDQSVELVILFHTLVWPHEKSSERIDELIRDSFFYSKHS